MYSAHRGSATELFPTVLLPGRSYLANVSQYFLSLRMQETGRTALCETQPDPPKTLPIRLGERVWQNFMCLSYFSPLLFLSRFF